MNPRILGRRLRSVSLRVKLVVLFALILLGIAVFIQTFFPATMQAQALRAARDRGVAIANVLAGAVAPALDFDDAQNASNLLASLASTPEAMWASLDRPDGSRLAAFNAGRAPVGRPRLTPGTSTTMDDLNLRVVAAVRGLGGEAGTLTIGFSLTELNAENGRARATVATATAGMLVVGLLLCAVLGTLLVAPIKRVTDTALAIAHGSVSAEAGLKVGGHGEVSVMSAALDLMLRRLREQQTILASQSEASVEGILIGSTSGAVISSNRRFLDLWQIEPQHLQHLDLVVEAVAARALEPAKVRALFLRDSREDRREAGAPPGASGELTLLDGRTLAYYLAPVTSPAGERFGSGYYFRDVTPEKRAAEEIRAMHGRLMESSRQAGMAQVATGILHNVGNVLNSINVSATLALEHIGQSRAPVVKKAGELASELARDPTLGFANHPRARRLAPLLVELGDVLIAERLRLVGELESVVKNVDHVKQIVQVQNAYAKGGGLVEIASPRDVVEDAIHVHAQALVRHEIAVVRTYEDLRPSALDRHRILQILLNLFANAKHAMAQNKDSKQLRIAIARGEPDLLRVTVADNGVGIAPEMLSRIFATGYSTKKDGHGFGLHSAALAAQEMGGRLTCDSDGPGRGASFTLEIPYRPAREALA